ncbi:MAG: serpin family protein [Terrimicrobiaceae bacterium]
MTKPILLCLLLAAAPALGADATKPAATAVNALGIDLLAHAVKPGANTVLSPYSIQIALAMTYAGAEGETREEMARVLHYPAGEVHTGFSALQKDLAGITERTTKLARQAKETGGPSEPITLAIANRLFGQKGYDFRPAFLAFLKDKYEAPLEQLDFTKNPSAAAGLINAWVAKQTRDRIRNLVPEDALNDLTRLVLVNAIYLKAPWAEEFNQNATEPRPFHLAGGQSTKAPTMVRKDSFGYLKRDGYTAVTLPYTGGELQFLILLPDEPDGLPALERKLSASLLAECATLKAQDVLLYLPKFKLEPPLFQLSKTLQALGMKNAFDIPQGSANFDGIAPRRPNDYLYISDVFHKTFVEIDEKGTEAAAATAVVMMRAMAMPVEKKPVEVRVDRPFLFAIQHRASGACLFLGRVVNPGL